MLSSIVFIMMFYVETCKICSQALITRAIHSVGGDIKLLRNAFLINGILYVEKALLSGGFDAIKWHIGNWELNVK